MTREKLLITAVELEKKGHRYYSEHAREAENPLARRVLDTLAEQELEHIEFLEALVDGEPYVTELASSSARDEDIERAAREVFEKFSQEEIAGWQLDDESVYERARQMEIMSIRLYSELAEESEDEAEQEFLRQLVKEERRHLESIDNVQYYLQNTGDWLSMQESKRWNWMNV